MPVSDPIRSPESTFELRYDSAGRGRFFVDEREVFGVSLVDLSETHDARGMTRVKVRMVLYPHALRIVNERGTFRPDRVSVEMVAEAGVSRDRELLSLCGIGRIPVVADDADELVLS